MDKFGAYPDFAHKFVIMPKEWCRDGLAIGRFLERSRAYKYLSGGARDSDGFIISDLKPTVEFHDEL